VAAAGRKAEGFEAAVAGATSLTVGRFGAAAGFAEAACFDGLSVDEPLKTSDNHPASLTSTGSSTKAAITVTMVRRRGQTPRPRANFLPDHSKPCFLHFDAWPKAHRLGAPIDGWNYVTAAAAL
jgi:hypothetical protein